MMDLMSIRRVSRKTKEVELKFFFLVIIGPGDLDIYLVTNWGNKNVLTTSHDAVIT